MAPGTVVIRDPIRCQAVTADSGIAGTDFDLLAARRESRQGEALRRRGQADQRRGRGRPGVELAEAEEATLTRFQPQPDIKADQTWPDLAPSHSRQNRR